MRGMCRAIFERLARDGHVGVLDLATAERLFVDTETRAPDEGVVCAATTTADPATGRAALRAVRLVALARRRAQRAGLELVEKILTPPGPAPLSRTCGLGNRGETPKRGGRGTEFSTSAAGARPTPRG
jgi:hypothetical protein